MESLKMPLREIQAKYTKSELMIMGWRSAEMAYNMRQKHGTQNYQPRDKNQATVTPRKATTDYSTVGETEQVDLYHGMPTHGVTDAHLRFLEERLGPKIVAQLEDEKTGEFTLKKLTGPQAAHYLRTMGVPIMSMSRAVRPR
jgi:hypothetical protein